MLIPTPPATAAHHNRLGTLYRSDIYAAQREIDGRTALVHGWRNEEACAIDEFAAIEQGMTTLPDEIIIETVTLGGSQRVTAIDPASLVEVVFQAPLTADLAAIQRLARQKLAYRLGRSAGPDRPPPGRGGILA